MNIYSTFEKYFKDHKECCLCQRGFDDGQEAADFLRRIKETIKKQKKIIDADGVIEEARERMNLLESVKELYETSKRDEEQAKVLRSEIQERKVSLETYEGQLDSVCIAYLL